MRPMSTFFDIQLSNSRGSTASCDFFDIMSMYFSAKRRLDDTKNCSFLLAMIPSLTVRKRKNRCIPCGYWAAAIFAVVTDYSILFFPFTFFLNISHFTFCYELIICSETTDVMKIIRNSFSFV